MWGRDETKLLAAISGVEKKYRVSGLFTYEYHPEISERHIRAYGDKPARTECTVRYQLTVSRNETAIAEAQFQAGWRIYATNAPTQKLTLSEAVLAYRDQYLEENVFRSNVYRRFWHEVFSQGSTSPTEEQLNA